MTEKTAKPARKPATTRRKLPTARRRTTATAVRTPNHSAISERAYYIHLDEGGNDELANWLRAERELTRAA